MTHLNLTFEEGCRLYASGHFSKATAVFKYCLEYDQHNPDLLNALGSAVDAAGGATEEAAAYLDQACRLRPDSAPFHYNLANLLRKKGDRGAAENEYLEAVQLDPQLAEALHGLGSIYFEEGKLESAEACLQRAVSLSPGLVPALHDLAQLCDNLARKDEAEELYRRTLLINPSFLPALNSLGMLLLRQGRVEEAKNCFTESIRINPDYLLARCNLAVLSTWCGELDFAIEELRALVDKVPEEGDIRFNLSLALLADGRFAEGFRELEWRFDKSTPVPLRHAEVPRWSGEESLAGKRILIHAEQGYGDSLQFIRYATVLADRGAVVHVEGQDRIITPLLSTVTGVASAFPRGESVPDIDFQIPMMSLPLAIGETAWPPPSGPYLHPPAEKTAHWRQRLAGLAGYKVGLAWAGRPEHENDSNRSLSESALAPLGAIPGISWVSLQFGSRSSSDLQFHVNDYNSEISDFNDSAALISNLDLVITIDSATAHLAGGLGVPTLLLLPWNPDWRWMHGRNDSYWYPSIRLLRQSSGGTKAAVVEKCARELLVLLGNGDA